jgi:hypothetical protein
MNKWMILQTGRNPLKVAAGYKLNGKPLSRPDEENFDAMSFLAPIAVSAMINHKSFADRDWVNLLWTFMLKNDIANFNYFDNTIKMMSLIILSGNYWDPAISSGNKSCDLATIFHSSTSSK